MSHPVQAHACTATICSAVLILCMLTDELLPSCCSSVQQAEAPQLCTVQMTARRLPLLLLRATRPPPPPLPPAAADPIRRDSQAARLRRAPRRRAAVMAPHPQLPPPLMVRKFRVQHQGRDGRHQYVINYCFQQDCLADGHAIHMYVLQLVVKGLPVMLVLQAYAGVAEHACNIISKQTKSNENCGCLMMCGLATDT